MITFLLYFLLPLLAVLTAISIAMIISKIIYDKEQTKSVINKIDPQQNRLKSYNPFVYGNPVSLEQFIGRTKELRRIISRMINGGQSSAITSSLRGGKTSILKYLIAVENRKMLYGNKAEQLIFSYLDCTQAAQFDSAQFWDYVLEPLSNRISLETSLSLSEPYQACQENNYKTQAIERLIAQIKQAEWQLVLVLDEFDVLLHHPILNSAEFFGGLRTLASLSEGALTLIITTNTSLAQLNQSTQSLTKTGSPYFNIMGEITLLPLSDNEIDRLLDKGKQYFTDDDNGFIKNIAGGHPYLLQVAASVLWEFYEEKKEEDVVKRQHIRQEFYNRTKETLNHIWQSWAPMTRKIFTFIALAHLKTEPTFLESQQINIKPIIKNLSNFKDELQQLEQQGFVIKDKQIDDGWRIVPTIFLNFVAERTEQEFDDLVII
jgi:hypothetical protein